jgi:8-oxo-dGTP diphosphatase
MIMYTLGILEKNGKILFLLRKNTPFFSNYFGLIGGKVDQNESPAAALIRETYEEVGITITQENVRFAHCLSFKNEKGLELMALAFRIINWHGEIINREPDKQSEIGWFLSQELPENTIPRHRQIIEMVEQNVMYSEDGW